MSTVQGGQGNIVTNGLVLNLDAANPRSYPQPYNGTIWQNIAPVSSSISGSLVNGVGYTGSNGGTLVFDGVNDYISTPLQNLDRPCTFSTWFNLSLLTGYQTFFGQDTSVSIPRGRFYFQKSGGTGEGIELNKVNFAIVKTDGSIVPTNGLNVLQINTWYNYTAVLTTTNISLYENGILQNTTTNSDSFITPNTNIVLNAGYYTNNIVDFINGKSSIFQIYNRALSASEVLQNFNATRARFGV